MSVGPQLQYSVIHFSNRFLKNCFGLKLENWRTYRQEVIALKKGDSGLLFHSFS